MADTFLRAAWFFIFHEFMSGDGGGWAAFTCVFSTNLDAHVLYLRRMNLNCGGSRIVAAPADTIRSHGRWNQCGWKRFAECRKQTTGTGCQYNFIHCIRDLQIVRTHTILSGFDQCVPGDWRVTPTLMEQHFHSQFCVVQRLLVEYKTSKRWTWIFPSTRINKFKQTVTWLGRGGTVSHLTNIVFAFAYVPNNMCDDNCNFQVNFRDKPRWSALKLKRTHGLKSTAMPFNFSF